MEKFKIRLLNEYIELSDNLDKLERFIKSDKHLDFPDLDLMKEQASVMASYKKILEVRIHKLNDSTLSSILTVLNYQNPNDCEIDEDAINRDKIEKWLRLLFD